MSTNPLTPEEVAKRRLPEGYSLSQRGPNGTKWWILATTSSPYKAPKTESLGWGLAAIAANVANGHLPPSVLDAVWAAVEGKVEYYSQDQDGNVERFPTEKDAQLDACEAFDEAVDGAWEEGVSRVEYGVIIRLGGARATGKTSQDEDGNTVTEYEMVTR